jgi:hypothetical protein
MVSSAQERESSSLSGCKLPILQGEVRFLQNSTVENDIWILNGRPERHSNSQDRSCFRKGPTRLGRREISPDQWLFFAFRRISGPFRDGQMAVYAAQSHYFSEKLL